MAPGGLSNRALGLGDAGRDGEDGLAGDAQEGEGREDDHDGRADEEDGGEAGGEVAVRAGDEGGHGGM